MSNYQALPPRNGVSLARESATISLTDHHNIIGWMDYSIFGLAQAYDGTPIHTPPILGRFAKGCASDFGVVCRITEGGYLYLANLSSTVDKIEGLTIRRDNILETFRVTEGHRLATGLTWGGAAIAKGIGSGKAYLGNVSLTTVDARTSRGIRIGIDFAVTGLTEIGGSSRYSDIVIPAVYEAGDACCSVPACGEISGTGQVLESLGGSVHYYGAEDGERTTTVPEDRMMIEARYKQDWEGRGTGHPAEIVGGFYEYVTPYEGGRPDDDASYYSIIGVFGAKSTHWPGASSN